MPPVDSHTVQNKVKKVCYASYVLQHISSKNECRSEGWSARKFQPLIATHKGNGRWFDVNVAYFLIIEASWCLLGTETADGNQCKVKGCYVSAF